MSSHGYQPGIRVTALREVTDDNTAYMFGDGVYVGDVDIETAAVFTWDEMAAATARAAEMMPQVVREALLKEAATQGWSPEKIKAEAETLEAALQELAKIPVEERVRRMIRDNTTAKIELDCGVVVYGHQCWWGPEDEMREALKERGSRIVQVDTAKELARNAEDRS